MGTCLDRGIKVVRTPAGSTRPAAPRPCRRWPTGSGWRRAIAYVDGDDLLARLDELVAAGHALAHLDTGEPLGDRRAAVVTANAYLGCWGIVEALGARRRHRDHRPGDRRRRSCGAGGLATTAGPATTGTRWPAPSSPGTSSSAARRPPAATTRSSPRCPTCATPGFPIAEVAADGSSVITQAPGHGRRVDVGTVTSQLLYEIGSPALPRTPTSWPASTPSRSSEDGPDRVRIGAVRGEPPPPTLKVGDQRRRRLPQHVHGRPDRARHRGQGGAARGAVLAAIPGGRDAFAFARAAARPHRPRRPGDERGGHRAAAADGEGPRRAQGRAGVLRAWPSSWRWPRSRASTASAAGAGQPVRRVLAHDGPGRPRAPRRRVVGDRVTVVDADASPTARHPTIDRRSRWTSRRRRRVRPVATAARPRRRRPLGRQGRDRQPRRVRPLRRGATRGSPSSSPSSGCGPSCRPRRRAWRSGATSCPTCGRSTS